MTTKEEVLRLAEQAGFGISSGEAWLLCIDYKSEHYYPATYEITKLIELAKQAGAAEEREACAKLCIEWGNGRVPDGGGNALRNAAEAIRNRESK